MTPFTDPYVISCWLGLLTGLPFGFLVFFKSQNRKIAAVWLVFSISVCGWLSGGAFIPLAKTETQTMAIWHFATYFGAFLVPPSFYHFTCLFLNLKRKNYVLFNYSLGVLLAFTLPFGLYYSKLELLKNSLWYPRGGGLHPLVFFWFVAVILYSHFEMLRVYPHSNTLRKNQIKYFFLATLIGFSGGINNFLVSYDLIAYPWGNFTIFLYPIIMAYALLKYRLMDVSLFLKRAVLLLFVYAFLVLIGTLSLWFSHLALGRTAPWSSTIFIVDLIILSTILSSGPFLYAFFIRKSSFFHETNMMGLTHELKSPLASIQNATDLIKDRLAPQSRKDLEPYLQILEKNSTRLAGFVNTLLSSTHQQMENLHPVLSSQPIGPLVEEILNSYSPIAEEKGTALMVETPLNGLQARINREGFTQILSNVISNGIKFTRGGCVSLDWKKEGGILLFSVKDNGKGVQRKDLNKIFDRFYTAKNGQTSQGTGLGLFIAKRWVEAHGGKIWAESEGEGKGARIFFTIPNQI